MPSRTYWLPGLKKAGDHDETEEEEVFPRLPGLMLSPMIDLIFLLLVFFVVSTCICQIYKRSLSSFPRRNHSEHVKKSGWTVTVKADGTLYLADERITEQLLLERMRQAAANDPDFAVMLRGEKEASYDTIMHLLDACQGRWRDPLLFGH